LHQLRIIHRDLKPSNILVDKHGSLHIADFGLAKWSESFTYHTKQMVTLQYRAPEILLDGAIYAESSDVWSMGCILAEMATAKILFCGSSEIEQLRMLMRYFGKDFSETASAATLRHNLTDGASRALRPRLANEVRSSPGVDDGDLQRVQRVLPKEFTLTDSLTGSFCRLVAACLSYHPEERCAAAEARVHDFFSVMDID
jgi:serine/threonine protein kinase